AAESGMEYRCVAGKAELLERLPGRAREAIQQETLTRAVDDVVEEGSEPGAADLRAGVRHRLHQRLQVELGSDRRAGRVQHFEDAALFAQRIVRELAIRDVL